LDDTPIAPGEERATFEHSEHARDALNEAESGLKGWSPSVEPITYHSANRLGANAMPDTAGTLDQPSTVPIVSTQQSVEDRERAEEDAREPEVPSSHAQDAATNVAAPTGPTYQIGEQNVQVS